MEIKFPNCNLFKLSEYLTFLNSSSVVIIISQSGSGIKDWNCKYKCVFSS